MAGLQPEVYEKGLADLERFGFIRFNTSSAGVYSATTEYLATFKGAIRDRDCGDSDAIK